MSHRELVRRPTETNAAWTQHLGELMKDYYRLALRDRIDDIEGPPSQRTFAAQAAMART